MCELSKTDRDAPRRTKLLIDIEDPRAVISITDRANSDPNRATPKTDREAPKRTTLRTAIDEPILQ